MTEYVKAPKEPKPGVNFPDSATRHGTISGHRKHCVEGTEPCEICRQAKAAYDYRWRNADERTKRNRLAAKAQQQANSELARRHYEEYRAIYDELYEELLAEVGMKRRTKPYKRKTYRNE